MLSSSRPPLIRVDTNTPRDAGPPTGRNLVLCFDGTSDMFGAGTDKHTNVVRMFELLQKDSQQQICYYQPWIGTYDVNVPLQEQTTSLPSKLSMIKDATLANGIQKHILGAYRFLMTHYRLGDQIYMFGFSRGAYAARALCGMLEKVGLLSSGNGDQVTLAWELYKRKENEAEAAKFREVFCQDIRVYFLGLWETVMTTRQELPGPQTDGFISYVYHALALDERRINFSPHFYPAPQRKSNDKSRQPTEIFERWFVGDHSDVGGRFPFQELDQNALANPPFRWIVWGASRAAANINRPLLFNARAFHKYLDILVYSTNLPTRKSISAEHLCRISPGFDSSSGNIDSASGRPATEIECTQVEVSDPLRGLSVWVVGQLIRGRGPRGKARKMSDDHILHASVQGRLYKDLTYGGKRREELRETRSDEAVAKVIERPPTPPACGPCPSLHIEPASPVPINDYNEYNTTEVTDVSVSLLRPDDAYRRSLMPSIGSALGTNPKLLAV